MSEFQKPKHGEFCWMELASNNLEACKSFYTDMFGWSLTTSNAAGMEYTEISAGEKKIGGMYQMSDECGDGEGKMMPPHWGAYIAVDDVNASVEKVKALGGNVCVPPTDIPNVGRFSVINDPSGAMVSLITFKGGSQ